LIDLSPKALLAGPAGGLCARPWFDSVVLGALKHVFFPTSRLWAAAEEANGDQAQFFDRLDLTPTIRRQTRAAIALARFELLQQAAALADQARQHGAGAHIAAGQPDPHEQKRHLGAFGAVAQVRCHGDAGAGAGADAVDGGDHRLAAGAHGLDQIAGHAGEFQKLRHLHLGQRADDFMHITTRAKITAGAGDDHRINILGVVELAEGVAQLGV